MLASIILIIADQNIRFRASVLGNLKGEDPLSGGKECSEGLHCLGKVRIFESSENIEDMAFRIQSIKCRFS